MAGSSFDTVIIGGGIGGLMAAYRLKKNSPEMKIAVTERGNTLENRKCPAGKNNTCAHCKICSITSGFAGAGAFSDGKFNLGTAYGGTLGEELGDDTANKYIAEVDEVLNEYCTSGIPKVYNTNDELKLKCIQNNLRLLDMNVKHLGTDNNYITMQNLINAIKAGGTELFSFYDCINAEKENDIYKLIYSNGETLTAKNVIIATGRGGANFVSGFCKKFDVKTKSNHIDIGVRVEMKDLSQIVLEILASLNSMSKQKERLIEITVDGKISGDELKDFIGKQEELEKISMAVEALQLWAEQMLATGAIDVVQYSAHKNKEC